MRVVLWVVLLSAAILGVLSSPAASRISETNVGADENLELNHSSDLEMAVMRGIRPQLKRRQMRVKRFLMTINFAANDQAWLYINGVEKGYVGDRKKFESIQAQLGKGDVVAIKAKNDGGWRGVIVDITSNCTFVCLKRHRYTSWTRDTGWRAHKAVGASTFWTSQKYSSCDWENPVMAANGKESDRALKFPDEGNGPQYVWANTEGPGDEKIIWLRYVMGGERCLRQRYRGLRNPIPRRHYHPHASHRTNTPQIASSSPSPSPSASSPAKVADTHCRCKPIPNVNGYCYELRNPNRKHGACDKRLCEPKYECDDNGEYDCIRRIAAYKIVRHPIYYKLCSRISTTPQYFYTLY